MRFNYKVRSINPLSITLRATGFETILRIFNLPCRGTTCGRPVHTSRVIIYHTKSRVVHLKSMDGELSARTDYYEIIHAKPKRRTSTFRTFP